MGRPRKSDVYKANATALGDLARPLREAARTLRGSAERGYTTIDNFDWLGDTREAAVGRAERDMTANRVKADHLDELADAHENGSKTMQPMIEGLKSKGQGLEGNHFEVAEDWKVTDKYDYDAARKLAKMMDPDGTAGLQAQVDQLQAQRANEATTETGNLQKLADELGAADTNTDTAIGKALAALEQTPAPAPAASTGTTAQQATYQQDKPTKPDASIYKDWYPKGTNPTGNEAATAVAPADPNAPKLGPPVPEQKPVYDPKTVGSLGGVTNFLEANKKPDARPADQPAPQQKGFIDGWVDEAKKTASGIVEHAGDLVGLHGADKAKDAWIQTATGMGMQLVEADPTFGPAVRNYENQVETLNNAAETIQHPEDTPRRLGAQTFDFQAKLGADAIALGTGGIGRVAEGGIIEGALAAEGRAGLADAAVPAFRGAVADSVKGFFDDITHPHVEAPATPHVETPSLSHVEAPATPHVEAPVAPHVETPAAPHAETPTAPRVETPAAPHVEASAAPHVETPAAPRAEVPATPHVEGPTTPRVEAPVPPHLETPSVPHVGDPAPLHGETPAAPHPEVSDHGPHHGDSPDAPPLHVEYPHVGETVGGSTYDTRLDNTPINNGHWIGERGESQWVSENPKVNQWLHDAGVDGIQYHNGYPDFRPVSKGEVEITDMSTSRYRNFNAADQLFAPEWGMTPKEFAKWRSDNEYTWHEEPDLKTMQLVPSDVNGLLRHIGGVGEIKAGRTPSPTGDGP